MSSTTDAPVNPNCPSCSAVLVAGAAVADQPVLCPACGSVFVLRRPEFVVRTSRLAIASLILGIASLIGMCFTGIPAILMGLFALKEIRTAKGGLVGRRRALTGIVAGALFGILCAPCSSALLLPALQMLRKPASAAPAHKSIPPGEPNGETPTSPESEG